MGAVRLEVALFAAAVAVACGGTEAEPDDRGAEPARVPNPKPRYAHIDVDAAPPIDGGGGIVQIRCFGQKPFVCPLEDGTFACSAYPCIPDCTKVGCIGGEVCSACDGGFRCVTPGSGC